MKQSTTLYSGDVPVFQHTGLIVLPGGFRLVTDGLLPDSVIPSGAAFVADEIARTATLIKSSVVFEAATNSATSYKVAKGTQFIAGNNIGTKNGLKSIDVTAVDKTNVGYDVITVSATLGYVLNAGDVLIQTSNAAASGKAVVATGLTYNSVKVEANNTLTLAVGGVFYQRRIPAITDDVKAALPKIIFLQTK